MPEHHFVTEPIAHKIHGRSQEKRYNRPLTPSNYSSNPYKENGQKDHDKKSSCSASHP
jgi:hypothetical protein